MPKLVTLEGLSGCNKCGNNTRKSDGNTININVQGGNSSAVTTSGSGFGRTRPQGLSPEAPVVPPVPPAQQTKADTSNNEVLNRLDQIAKAFEKRNQPPAEGLSPKVIVEKRVVEKPVFIPTVIEKVKKFFTEKPYSIPTDRKNVETVERTEVIPTDRKNVETAERTEVIATDRKVVETVPQERTSVMERIKNRWIIVRQNQPTPPAFP